MEGFGDTEDLEWRLMTNPAFQNPNFQINHALQNHDLFQFRNPNGSQRYPITQTLPVHESLEECFSRMNLNHIQDTTRIGSDARGQIGSFHESFDGRHSNSTRSLGSQNMVRSENFPSTFMDYNVFDTNLQRRTLSLEELDYESRCYYRNATWADVNGFELSENSSSNLMPSMYNHPVSYPRQPRQEGLKYSSLKELKGEVCTVAKDQSGCCFLQKKLDHEIITREDIEMIFTEVKDHLHELMVHQFANYLIQKLFKASNQEGRTQLLLLLVSSQQRLLEVCTDVYGEISTMLFLILSDTIIHFSKAVHLGEGC